MLAAQHARRNAGRSWRDDLLSGLSRSVLIAVLTVCVQARAQADGCPPLREPRIPPIPGPVDRIDPVNINKVKTQLTEYKAGNYDYDLAAVIADARVYIERRMKQPITKPAVVLDIDETSLSNWPNLKADDFGFFLDVQCESSDRPCGFNNWVMMGTAPAIPPTQQFFNYLISEKIAVFFVTGRREKQRAKTEENLEMAGFKGWTRLITQPDDDRTNSIVGFKSGQRENIEKEGYTIMANIGDQKSDLEGNASGAHAECGFKLPNPFYLIP
jgi:acid phosphatase